MQFFIAQLSSLLFTLAAIARAQNASSAGLINVVTYLEPGATVTSISPEQSSALISDAQAYVSSFTATKPVAGLVSELAVPAFLATSAPSPQDISSLQALFADGNAIVSDPAGFSSKLDSMLAPFPFATSAVHSYENELVQGLRTVVASELSLPVPTQTTTAAPSASTGAAAGMDRSRGAAAVAAAAAVAGAAVFNAL